jgi:hypothetical protein
MRELQQLEYEDALVTLNSMFEQYGVRQVMQSFRGAYPQMFEEMIVQLARLQADEKIPMLFLPFPNADSM